MGDGFCHDVFNVEECSYDGGDCCSRVVYTNACKECKCLNPEINKPTTELKVAVCPEELNWLVGDGQCDDETNNPKYVIMKFLGFMTALYVQFMYRCNYDGYDCCNRNIDTIQIKLCDNCICFFTLEMCNGKDVTNTCF